jgi:DNA-binding response OmpR family regulator
MTTPEDKKQLGRIPLERKAVPGPGARRAREAEVERLGEISDRLGVPGLDVGQVVIPLENLELVPFEIAKQHLILPVLVKDDRMVLAMAKPDERRTIDEIEFVTGKRVMPYVALPDSLADVIARAYDKKHKGEDYFIGEYVTGEYLKSIGLGHLAGRVVSRMPDAPSVTEAVRSRPVPPPPPAPPQAVMKPLSRVPVVPPNGHEDDLGISELTTPVQPKGPALDDAFGSRVSPMPTAPRVRPANPKVLVVDDEDDIRKLLVRVLTQKGYEVIEAAKGIEALQLVRDNTPDVILLDAMLPEVHGFEICRRIKGSQRYGHIPIIMVSAIYRGWRVAEDLKTSYGVEAFLEKPFKIQDVVTHVENALAGRGSQPHDEDALSKDAQSILELAMASYRAGDVDAAITKLREGIQVDPLAFQLHYHLGLLWGRRDNLFDAIQELERAVDLAPRHFSALKNLAVLYQRVGFKHKAIEIWERALGNAPDDETRQGIKELLVSLL